MWEMGLACTMRKYSFFKKINYDQKINKPFPSQNAFGHGVYHRNSKLTRAIKHLN